MEPSLLSSAQKSRLRSLGQTLADGLDVGKAGLTPALAAELERQLAGRELVKLRFHGADRHERAALCDQIAAESRSHCVGAVGHTALFFRQNPDPKARRIAL